MNNSRADGGNSKLEYPYELTIAIWHLRARAEHQIQVAQADWPSDHPMVQDMIKRKDAAFCKLYRIVTDKRLEFVWPEVERLLQTDQPKDLPRLYEDLLRQMVYGPPSLIKTPPQ